MFGFFFSVLVYLFNVAFPWLFIRKLRILLGGLNTSITVFAVLSLAGATSVADVLLVLTDL